MITVNSCCCLKLETGVLIITVLVLIGNVPWSIASVVFFIFGVSCNTQEIDAELCPYFIGISTVILLLCILVTFIACRCIKGVETRDHSKVKPMVVLLGIAIVLPTLWIILFAVLGVVLASVGYTVNGYCFVVAYSLYKVFRRECESGGYSRTDFQYPVAEKV